MKAVAKSGHRTLFVAEPPIAYQVRPPVVVDSSAICAILFDEAERVEAMSHISGKKLHAPYLLDHEVLNVTLKKRRQKWPVDSLALVLSEYEAYDIELHETDLAAQYELAARYGLSAYDAAYLWLAADLKASLATFDGRLAAAARTHLASLP